MVTLSLKVFFDKFGLLNSDQSDNWAKKKNIFLSSELI